MPTEWWPSVSTTALTTGCLRGPLVSSCRIRHLWRSWKPHLQLLTLSKVFLWQDLSRVYKNMMIEVVPGADERNSG